MLMNIHLNLDNLDLKVTHTLKKCIWVKFMSKLHFVEKNIVVKLHMQAFFNDAHSIKLNLDDLDLRVTDT